MKLTDKFEKLPGVYILRCQPNGKYYVGETMSIHKRMGEHSKFNKQVIHKAIIKYGIDAFTVETYYLPSFSKDDLIELEEQMIIKFNSLVPNGYNICKKGMDGTGRTHSEEVKKKLSIFRTGSKLSEETKNKISKSNIGKVMSKESVVKRIESFTGFKHSEECKNRMSKLKIGKKASDESKKKMSLARSGENHHNYGKPMYENARTALIKSRKGIPPVNKGVPMSEEQKIKLSESRKRMFAERKLKESNSSII